METSLVKVAEESGLDKTQSTTLLTKFQDFFTQAKEWEAKAKTIVVKSLEDTKEMKLAREARLELKRIRVNAENVRKELKERSLREGKAIDGVANVIKALVVPIEEYLENQEKFAEKLAEIEREKFAQERAIQLGQYITDTSFYNLKDMSEEGFQELLKNSRIAQESQKEAERKAEEDRVVREKVEAEERERMRVENEKLKKEAEAREKALAKERAEQEKKLEAERAKARAEAEAREKVEQELRNKAEAEAKAKQEKEEAEKALKLAPDRDKLYTFSNAIASVSVPRCSSEEAQKILETAEDEIRLACRKMCLAIDKLTNNEN